MPISYDIEKLFPKEALERLTELLGAADAAELDEAFDGIGRAALVEYVEMLAGPGLPSRADEVREHRLFHLIEHHHVDHIPSEAEVSAMFQLTMSRSRSLLRNVLTRFRRELEAQRLKTLKDNLDEATFDQDREAHLIVIQADWVHDELSQIIARNAPKLDAIGKVRGMARVYEISEDSFEVLRQHIEQERAALEADHDA